MASNFNEDCLSNILEHLSGNLNDLSSCARINLHWSKVAVTILWRNNPWKHTFYSLKFWRPISNTILLSLPERIKEFLIYNGVTKSKIMNKNSGYNYVSYCQILSQNLIYKLAYGILHRNNYKTNRNYYVQSCLIEELWKLFLNNIKKIEYFTLPNDISLLKFYNDIKYDATFQSVTKLECSTRILPEIFIQLSKFLNDISELIIYIYFNYPNYDNNGLATLIACQSNLKCIRFISYDYEVTKICPNLSKSLESLANILISLQFKEESFSYLMMNDIILMNLKHLLIDLGKDNIFIDKSLITLKTMNLPLLEILEITSSEISSLDPLISLIQQTKYMLKKIKIDTDILDTKDFSIISNYINAIIAYCPLIESLNLWVTKNELNDIETLLISCINIEYLQLEAILEEDDEGEGVEEEEDGDDNNNNKFLEAGPFLKLFSLRKLGKLKEIKLTGKWYFTKEDLENFLMELEKNENFGLKIEFHNIKGDKEEFGEICQKFDEKDILGTYEFRIT